MENKEFYKEVVKINEESSIKYDEVKKKIETLEDELRFIIDAQSSTKTLIRLILIKNPEFRNL